jgi:hypothetical protein
MAVCLDLVACRPGGPAFTIQGRPAAGKGCRKGSSSPGPGAYGPDWDTPVSPSGVCAHQHMHAVLETMHQEPVSLCLGQHAHACSANQVLVPCAWAAWSLGGHSSLRLCRTPVTMTTSVLSSTHAPCCVCRSCLESRFPAQGSAGHMQPSSRAGARCIPTRHQSMPAAGPNLQLSCKVKS